VRRRQFFAVSAALALLVVGIGTAQAQEPAAAPTIVKATATDISLSAVVSPRRIDVTVSYTTDAQVLTTLLALDDGPLVIPNKGDSYLTPERLPRYTYTASLGARPGKHVVTLLLNHWPNHPGAKRTLTVTVPPSDAETLTLTRPETAAPSAEPGGAAPFLALIPPEPGTGRCPATYIDYHIAGEDIWHKAALAWRTGAASGGCDLEIMALGAPDSAEYRVRTRASGRTDEVSASWYLENLRPKAPLAGNWERIALSPDLIGWGPPAPLIDWGRGTILVTYSSGHLALGFVTRADPYFPGRSVATYLQGTGWRDLALYGPGDWDGDGLNDVLATDVYGDLYLYPGQGNAHLGSRTRIGWGWGPFRIVPTGDLTGDHRADLLAIDNRGDLWLYPGAGAGRFGNRVKVGNGWSTFDLQSAGDMNGDGRADILGVDADGGLWFYAGRGDGYFAMRQKVGHGWNTVTLFSGADLTGDGLNDLLGEDADAQLWCYPGRSGGTFGMRFLVSR